MSGIIFFKTENLDGITAFYTRRIGMEIWLRQSGVTLLKHGNLLLGFHGQDKADRDGLITFFYPSRGEVDAMRREMGDLVQAEPQRNEVYNIYHFFASDPEGRRLEFQSFEHPLPPYLDGEELILSRRSIREYQPQPVEAAILEEIFHLCASAPSSKNSQPWYFVEVRDRTSLDRVAAVRGDSSAPIAHAPMAVAICTDPSLTGRPVEDGCIAASYFLLVSWLHGLGTCWIGGMNRDEVKDALGIPRDHFVATVTPLGYPAERPPARERRRIPVRG